jgi:hypothetical protein
MNPREEYIGQHIFKDGGRFIVKYDPKYDLTVGYLVVLAKPEESTDSDVFEHEGQRWACADTPFIPYDENEEDIKGKLPFEQVWEAYRQTLRPDAR